MTRKVIIIGSGPAGLTAGIYTGRAKLNPLVIKGNQPGGQLTTTTEIENWPGEISISGFKLMHNMIEHAKHYGAELIDDTVTEVDFSKKPYIVKTQSGKAFSAESIIVATGSSHKKLNIPGEKEYWAKGVSVCATCDGPFFQDKDVVIVGGGNSAIVEAHFLSRFAKKVTMVQNSAKLTATDPLKDDVLNNPKIEIIYNHNTKEIKGDGDKVTEVLLENIDTKEEKTISASGVFVAIGLKPNTDIFKGKLEIDQWGFLALKNNVHTSKEGIFAAGDDVDYKYRQAITAAGMGCMAALECEKYLQEK